MGGMFYNGNGEPDKQHAQLFGTMMDLIVHMLGPDLDPLTEELMELGERHAKYGVTSKHYPILGEALMKTLFEFLGEKGFVAECWMHLYRYISLVMIRGARRVRRQQITSTNKRHHQIAEENFDPTEVSSSSSTSDEPLIVVDKVTYDHPKKPQSLIMSRALLFDDDDEQEPKPQSLIGLVVGPKRGYLNKLRRGCRIRKAPARTKSTPLSDMRRASM
jgi:hemoglobin-like flavoprotein